MITIDFDALTLDKARELWRKHLKLPLPQHRSRDLMTRALSHHLQARARGGLTQVLRRKLDDLAPRFTPIAISPPLPPNGPSRAVCWSENGTAYASPSP